MATTKTSLIDVRRTAASKKDMAQLGKDLVAASNSVNALVKGFQDLSKLSAAAKANAAFSNNLGVGAFNRGTSFREKQRASDTARLGTGTGQELSNQERLVKELQKEMKTREGMAKIRQAQALSTTRQIKDLEKLTQAGEVLKVQELARLKNAEARSRLTQLMTTREAQNATLRDRTLDPARRPDLKAERDKNNSAIAAVRREIRGAEKLEQSSMARLEALKRITQEKAEQAKFDRESERLQSKTLSARNTEARNRQAQRQAEQLNLRKSISSVEKINNLESLKTLKLRAQNRLRVEEGKGNLRSVDQARKLNSLLDQRIRKLKQSSVLTADQKSDEARKNAMRRVFGDNGASLFAIQAGLVANYALMNQLRTGFQQAITFTIDLDAAMRNLQAIVRITDTDLGNLKDNLIAISEETKFTAVEVANAAVTLGQAGFSTNEIQDSIRAVSLLATATGTDLNRAVDIATSTLGVFNMESSQMADVANILTEAVNTSKLNIEKLTLGLQYSGNIAAQSGVSFKELTSALGAMANAGIRSGSTLGTGMRQILIALQKPSKAFSETLMRLGLTMDDVNLETKGLYGALKNLRDAGFSSADAIKAFEVRAAAAYNALSGNLDQMLSLQNAFQRTSASIKANETQMRSLRNQSARLGSVLGSVAAAGLDPMLKGLTAVTKALADAFAWVRKFEEPLAFLTTVAASAALVGIAVYFGRMAKSLAGIVFSARAATGAMAALNLSLSLTPIGAAIVGVSALIGVWALFGGRAKEAAANLEKAQTAFDRSIGSAEKMQKTIARVDGTLQDLLNRYDMLRTDSGLLESAINDVQKQFVEMGRDADNVGDDVIGLVKTLRNLRRELAEEYVISLTTAATDLDSLAKKTQISKEQSVQDLATSSYVRRGRQAGAEAFAGRGVAGVNAVAAPLFDNATTLNQQGVALSRLRSQQADLERAAQDGKDQLGDQAMIDYLGYLITEGEKTKTLLIDLANIERQKAAVLEQTNTALDIANRSTSTLAASALELDTEARSRVGGGLGGKTARERFMEARGRQELFEKDIADATRQQQTLVANGTYKSKSEPEMVMQRLREASGKAQQIVSGFKEEFEKVEEKLASEDLKGEQAKLEKLSREVSEAKGLGAIEEAVTAQVAQLELVRVAEIKAIKARKEDPELEKALIATANREYDGESSLMSSSALDRASAILNTFWDQNEALEEQAQIQEAIRKFGRDSTEVEDLNLKIKKEALRTELETMRIPEAMIQARLALMDRELKLAREIKASQDNEKAREALQLKKEQNRLSRMAKLLGEDNLLVVKMRQRAEYKAYENTLKSSGASEDLKNELLEAFRAGQRIERLDLAGPIRAALRVATQLGGRLKIAGRQMLDLKDRQNLAQNRIDNANDPIAIARGEAGIQYDLSVRDLPPAAYDPALRGQLMEQAAITAAAVKKADELNQDPDKGGSGGNPEFDLLMDRMLNQIDSSTIAVEDGTMDPAEGLALIEASLARANSEMEKRKNLIGLIASKTNRTKQEEEQLVELIRQHRELAAFAKDEEREILWLKERQGTAQLDLNTHLKEWARDSLSPIQALEEGLTGMMEGLLSGFAQLFTEIVSGTKSMKDSFRDFAVSVVKSLLAVIAKLIAISILKSIISGLGPDSKVGGFLQGGLDMMVPSTAREGKYIRKAGGGEVEGNLSRDSKLHLLMPGEYVLRKSATDMMGVENLNRINAMGNRKASGGLTGAATRGGGAPGQATNIYVVTPEQKPVPGPGDIIAVLDDNIARGGSTKKLIKSVVMGEI